MAMKNFLRDNVHIEDMLCEITEAQCDEIKEKHDVWYDKRPVVFISPYEHHSNILIWRESIAEVVEIKLNEAGYMDLEDLENHLKSDQYKDRQKIGSFSAASNVTGIKTEVYDVAALLHKYHALACFDFAASGPYVEIDMNKDEESYFDAIFISPHKFLGGPSASGILVLNENVYNKDLPPTTSGGGTVDYVSPFDQDYYEDPEVREMAGTPGILQIIRAALVFDLKDKIGIQKIDLIEETFLKSFIERFKDNEKVDLLGPMDPEKRVAIISFMIKQGDKYLHPRFITKLMNDLFGIQSRAGCACAGPYGHKLLGIDDKASQEYRAIIKEGVHSLKPGWTRINLHYVMTEVEVAYIMDAIDFIAEHGHLFLKEYDLDLVTGEWCHKIFEESYDLIEDFGIEKSLTYRKSDKKIEEVVDRKDLYKEYREYALKMAEVLALSQETTYSQYDNATHEHYRWFNFIKGKASS